MESLAAVIREMFEIGFTVTIKLNQPVGIETLNTKIQEPEPIEKPAEASEPTKKAKKHFGGVTKQYEQLESLKYMIFQNTIRVSQTGRSPTEISFLDLNKVLNMDERDQVVWIQKNCSIPCRAPMYKLLEFVTNGKIIIPQLETKEKPAEVIELVKEQAPIPVAAHILEKDEDPVPTEAKKEPDTTFNMASLEGNGVRFKLIPGCSTALYAKKGSQYHIKNKSGKNDIWVTSTDLRRYSALDDESLAEEIEARYEGDEFRKKTITDFMQAYNAGKAL